MVARLKWSLCIYNKVFLTHIIYVLLNILHITKPKNFDHWFGATKDWVVVKLNITTDDDITIVVQVQSIRKLKYW